MRRVVFLDIDGVVLPLSQATRRRYEDYLPGQIPQPLQRLVELLNEHPDIELVLSSSWRIDVGIERARELLPPQHRSRLIAQTPAIGLSADRGAECLQWMNGLGGECAFAALDDCRQLFAAEFKNLVLVDARMGITDEAVLALKQLLHL